MNKTYVRFGSLLAQRQRHNASLSLCGATLSLAQLCGTLSATVIATNNKVGHGWKKKRFIKWVMNFVSLTFKCISIAAASCRSCCFYCGWLPILLYTRYIHFVAESIVRLLFDKLYDLGFVLPGQAVYFREWGSLCFHKYFWLWK